MGTEAQRSRVLVSIDDTDNLESRGTGWRARRLGALLHERNLARVRGISRHQLHVHARIPMTSHNSALCLDIEWRGGDAADLATLTRAFLKEESAPGSDAGFCLARFEDVGANIVAFGRRAKTSVVHQGEARELAREGGFHLEGVTGDEGGVIGALASIGLRKSGHDGRFVWVAGVRELEGVTTLRRLLGSTGIDIVRPLAGEAISEDARISIDPWPRPVLLEDKAVLLVSKVEEPHAGFDWKLVPREIIKQY